MRDLTIDIKNFIFITKHDPATANKATAVRTKSFHKTKMSPFQPLSFPSPNYLTHRDTGPVSEGFILVRASILKSPPKLCYSLGHAKSLSQGMHACISEAFPAQKKAPLGQAPVVFFLSMTNPRNGGEEFRGWRVKI